MWTFDNCTCKGSGYKLRQPIDPSTTSFSGTITYAQTYDPGVYPELSRRGVTTSTAGSSQTDYGYTGEFTANDMVYLRARQYAPGMGRFLSRDTWEGDYRMPLSMNRWNYVEGNPINKSDPGGHYSCANMSSEDQAMCYAYNLSHQPGVIKYDEKMKPNNVTFTGGNFSTPKIIGYQEDCNKIVTPGDYQAQFIYDKCEPDWPKDKDKNGHILGYHSGLCGELSIAAILANVVPGLVANDVVNDFLIYRPNVAPDYTGISELGNFINDYYSNYMYAWNIDNRRSVRSWGGYKLIPSLIHNWLSVNASDNVREYLIAGVRVSGSSGQLRNGYGWKGTDRIFAYSGGAKHWVVITGISNEWENRDYSPWNWIRIYNPFNDQTEDYWWEDFWRSWEAESGSMLRVTMK